MTTDPTTNDAHLAADGDPTDARDLRGRTVGELLTDLTRAADRRRADTARRATIGDRPSDEVLITALEAALVRELRNRRADHRPAD